MNAEKIAIRILSLTAALLLAALVFLPKPAAGDQAKEGDFIIATGRSVAGSDAVFVAETRATGMIVAFVYDPQARGLVPRAMRPISDAFGGR